MFEPIYTITPNLLSTIKRVAVLIAELNRHSVSDVVLMELEQRAQALSAHASTRIEGNPLPLTEVKRILKSTPKNLRESEREVVNYNAALKHLDGKLRKSHTKFSTQLILDIHKRVMDGLQESYHCGRLRAEPVVVHNPTTGDVIYLTPDHKDVATLMDNLVSFVQASRKELDPLILAGLFHKQFVIIHPFTDGNGRTARLATKVLLAAMGIDTFPLFSFENYYNRNISRYFERVGLIGDYNELKNAVDFTSWLEYFADGILDELLRVRGELASLSATPETRLQPHHEAILRHIDEHGFITDRDYATLTERAKATRALDFKKLIELGFIERHGKGKNTHYKLRG